MKNELSNRELDILHQIDLHNWETDGNHEERKMKTKLTTDAIDTLIFNNFWDDDLPIVGHVKNGGHFLIRFSDGENSASVERKVGGTEYVLEMEKSGTDSRVTFNPGSFPLITTPDMIINGIYQMVSQMFKKAAD